MDNRIALTSLRSCSHKKEKQRRSEEESGEEKMIGIYLEYILSS